jgi:hypothetical protein
VEKSGCIPAWRSATGTKDSHGPTFGRSVATHQLTFGLPVSLSKAWELDNYIETSRQFPSAFMEKVLRVKQSKFNKKAASRSCERPELTF